MNPLPELANNASDAIYQVDSLRFYYADNTEFFSNGIFYNNAEPVKTQGDLQISSKAPIVEVQKRHFKQLPKQGDHVEINTEKYRFGTIYTIRDVQDNGLGLLKFILAKTNR